MSDAGPPRKQLLPFVAACAILSLTVLTGLRTFQVERFVAGHLAQIPAVTAGTPEVVLVRWRKGYYSVDLVQNDPFLRPTIFADCPRRTADSAMLCEDFPAWGCWKAPTAPCSEPACMSVERAARGRAPG